LKPVSVSTKQERIAKLARENPAMAFTSLNQYLDAEWLEYAFECTRKDGAVGVDGMSSRVLAAEHGRYRMSPYSRRCAAWATNKGHSPFHGFRTTASTLLNEQGWRPDAIERQLAHGERDHVRAVYNHAEYFPERKLMMQAWADYLDELRGFSV
jgi:integrase